MGIEKSTEQYKHGAVAEPTLEMHEWDETAAAENKEINGAGHRAT